MKKTILYFWASCIACITSNLAAQCPSGNIVTVTNNAPNNVNGSFFWALDCLDNAGSTLTTVQFDIDGATEIQPTAANVLSVNKAGAMILGTNLGSGGPIVIDGTSPAGPSSNGLIISQPNITVQDLTIQNFTASAGGQGILINRDGATVQSNTLTGNRIGIATSSATFTFNIVGNLVGGGGQGNTAAGVSIAGNPSAGVISGNEIAHNTGAGINVIGGTVLISKNEIYCNTTSGITKPAPPLPPTITLANTSVVRGTSEVGRLIEVFIHSTAGCAGAPVQGKTFLGSTTTPATGIWELTLTPGSVVAGEQVTATSTQNGNNTSVFSGAATVGDCSTFTVGITQMNVTCAGFDDGSATATPNNSSFQYVWSTGQTVAAINNLAPDTYTVTVTDNAGCTDSETVTILEPPVLGVSTGTTAISCFGGNDGTATVSPSGGTPGYNFIWNNGQTTATATGLMAGTYSVTVSDQNNCTITATAVVSQPPVLSLSLSSTPVSCFGGNNGTAAANPGGGTPGYSFLWSGGQTTASINGLTAGTYSVTVTDLNGCTIRSETTVVQPPALTLSTSSIAVSCFGGANGSATATPGGGSPGYTYSWNTGQNTASISGVVAGTYTVTVTDLNNCSLTQTASVGQPPALTLNVGATGVTTCGGADGTATATPGGGTPGYNYLWSNGQTAAMLNGLTAGTYTVTVTDQNNCTVTQSATVGQPVVLSLSVPATGVTCFGGANGSAMANPGGGSAPYSFAWSSGQTTAAVSGLTAGVYTVTVSDQNNCSATQTIAIGQPPALTLQVSGVNATNGNNGSALAMPGGGTPGYSFLWITGGSGQQIVNLAAGTYTVTITDSNGCTASGSVTVGSGGGSGCKALPVYALLAPSQVCGNTVFSLEADDLFPDPAVDYVWKFPNGDSAVTSQSTIDLFASSSAWSGEYYVIRDSAGCRSVAVGGAIVTVVTADDVFAGADAVICNAPGMVNLSASFSGPGSGAWRSLGQATIDNPGQSVTTGRNLQTGHNVFVWEVTVGNCSSAAADSIDYFVESPPRANDDHYVLQHALDEAVMEILLNDALAGISDTLLVQVSTPAAGTLELLDETRRFRYTVEEDFRGEVRFQYAVCAPASQCNLPCDTATVTIDVQNLPTVPTGLVVGDPGRNGALTIRGLNGFSRVEVTIVDRWGDLVFRENDYDNGHPWAGDFKRTGQYLPGGAYYYFLKAFLGDEQVGGTLSGVIHLFDHE